MSEKRDFPEKDVYTVAEAGDALRIGRSLAYRLAKKRMLPVVYLGNKPIVPRRALLIWLDKVAMESLEEGLRMAETEEEAWKNALATVKEHNRKLLEKRTKAS